MRLPLDRESGRPRAYGFVDFARREAAEAALAAGELLLAGDRHVTVAKCKKRGGGPPPANPPAPRFEPGPGRSGPPSDPFMVYQEAHPRPRPELQRRESIKVGAEAVL